MATLKQFKKGDVLLRQGDVSDHVLWLSSGEIEVVREVGALSVLLGHARPGEWLGEMGVMEQRPRSATALAITDGAVEVLSAQQFLDRVSSDPALARELILRLSARLKRVEDRIAADLMPFRDSPAAPRPDAAPIPPVPLARRGSITLAAQTDVLRERIGDAPVTIERTPFVVGRTPIAGEAEARQPPDLMIEDDEPFRLSRHHFMITRAAGRLLLLDLGSTLGTIVNGQALGHNFQRDSAPLHRTRDNHIAAGGLDSPHQFIVVIG